MATFFQCISFRCLQPTQSFRENSLLLTTQPLGVPGTLLIDLFTKPPGGFELASSWFEVGKKLIHYSFILTKQCIK